MKLFYIYSYILFFSDEGFDQSVAKQKESPVKLNSDVKTDDVASSNPSKVTAKTDKKNDIADESKTSALAALKKNYPPKSTAQEDVSKYDKIFRYIIQS